jgi:UDP-perosamine 4-acetyltransferase
MERSLILLGTGGHAKVLLDTLVHQSHNILGITSPNSNFFNNDDLFNIPIIGDDDEIFYYGTNSIYLVNGVGMMPGKNTRCKLYEKFKKQGYTFARVIHPSTILATDVELSAGVQIMAGSVIQNGVVIGENSIINTRVAIDHDSYIGKHVHLAPGATISGGVTIGEGTFVGAGSTIIQGIHISDHCIVAAGSVVTQNVPAGATVMGIPARVKPASK